MPVARPYGANKLPSSPRTEKKLAQALHEEQSNAVVRSCWQLHLFSWALHSTHTTPFLRSGPSAAAQKRPGSHALDRLPRRDRQLAQHTMHMVIDHAAASFLIYRDGRTDGRVAGPVGGHMGTGDAAGQGGVNNPRAVADPASASEGDPIPRPASCLPIGAESNAGRHMRVVSRRFPRRRRTWPRPCAPPALSSPANKIPSREPRDFL